jgi:hypothetical protein
MSLREYNMLQLYFAGIVARRRGIELKDAVALVSLPFAATYQHLRA